MHIAPAAPLDPWHYAAHIAVVVLSFEGDGSFDTLSRPAARARLRELGWYDDQGAGRTIVINPGHSRGRQSSTLMHELAHVQLKQVPARVDVSAGGLLMLSDYSEDAEAEADWLAAAMLFPRVPLSTPAAEATQSPISPRRSAPANSCASGGFG